MFSAAIKLQRPRADREPCTTDHHCRAFVGLDDKVGVLHTDSDSAAAESHPQLECRPRSGEDRIHMEHPGSGAEPGEPKCKGLPEATHRGEMQARRG